MPQVHRFAVLLLAALALIAPAARAQAPLDVDGLPDDLPFALTATVSELEIVVEVELESDWHLYARDVGGGRPVAIEVTGGGAFAAAGALRARGDARGYISGDARLVLPLERVGKGTAIEATFAFQICDALMCLPPMRVTLAGQVPPLEVLLVVAARDERSARIEDWLRTRGFDVAVTTYPHATLEACDARDVVVADSDYFGRPGASLRGVRELPRTTTPIVGVGFLGTELIEAHGVALTSGYI